MAIIVTTDTIMRWHRQLIALKWTFEAKRVGRPGLMTQFSRILKDAGVEVVLTQPQARPDS